MYAGTFSGGMRPYSLGESFGEGAALREYSRSQGYGPYLGGYGSGTSSDGYLGDLIDTIRNIAGKVATVAGEAADLRDNKTKLATVPANSPSLVLPGPDGTPVGISVPWWGIAAAGVGIFMLARGTKRRR